MPVILVIVTALNVGAVAVGCIMVILVLERRRLLRRPSLDGPPPHVPDERQQAEDGLRHDLQPGERMAAGSAVTSDPSPLGAAVLLAVALALIAAGLLSVLGPGPASPVGRLGTFLMLGVPFLARPMYLVVTDRRLIGCRLSRLRGAPGRIAFAVPFADLRILSYQSGKYGASLRCGIPGREPILLRWGRTGRKDFAEVEKVLARSGAFARLDPPYPSAESNSGAA